MDRLECTEWQWIMRWFGLEGKDKWAREAEEEFNLGIGKGSAIARWRLGKATSIGGEVGERSERGLVFGVECMGFDWQWPTVFSGGVLNPPLFNQKKRDKYSIWSEGSNSVTIADRIRACHLKRESKPSFSFSFHFKEEVRKNYALHVISDYFTERVIFGLRTYSTAKIK